MAKIPSVLVLTLALTSPVLAMSKKAPTPPAPVVSAATGAVPSEESVWVAKSDEAKSCGKDKGVGLDDMGTSLQGANVKVLSKRKLHDGKMRIQMCGVDKGDMNGFLIAKKDLEKAQGLGFKPVPNPPNE